MERREFITLAGGAAAAWPLTVRAQQPVTQRRIAIFHPAIPTTLLTETGGGSAWRAFFAELRRLGYIEGENLIIERYSAEGHHERYADMAREIVTRKPDLIVTGTNPVVSAFRAATSTIPVVAFMLDPLKAGLVTSLSRPGANVTGITLDAGIEIWGKRLQILKEAIPSTAAVGALFNPTNPNAKGDTNAIEEAARKRARHLVVVNAATDNDVDAAFAMLVEMVLNLKTAKARGLTVSNRMLVQADEIIE